MLFKIYGENMLKLYPHLNFQREVRLINWQCFVATLILLWGLQLTANKALAQTLSDKQDEQRAVAVGALNQSAVSNQENQIASKKVALVIGNSNYVNVSELKNPANDAASMAKTLRSFGFKVIEALDLTNQEMQQIVSVFEKELSNADVGLFFFAGHGVQVKGSNYLIPVSTSIRSESDVGTQSLSANRVLQAMENSGVKTSIIVLDACRNNPFASASRSMGESGGLARMDAPTGSIVIYATAPGRTASDGAGENGLFTGHLLQNMQVAGSSIYDIAIATRRAVMAESKGAQVPWELSSLVNQFYFMPTEFQQQAIVANNQASSNLAPNTTTLTLFTKPSSAKVTLLNSSQTYESGVVLPIDKYQVQVSASGYETMTRTLDLAEKNAYEFVLSPKLKDESIQVDNVFFTMKAIAGGEFAMGCDKQKDCPPRTQQTQQVYVDGFRLMDTETTWALYELCLDDGVCGTVAPSSDYYVNTLPVSGVPFLEITEAFIPWLEYKTGQGFRLPSEAEWEYAYKANSGLKVNLNSANGCRFGNYAGGRFQCNKQATIKPVKQYKMNAFGLYDMLGNVSEITADCYTRDLLSVPLDGSAQTQGDCKRRIIRGGAYNDDFREVNPLNRNAVNIEHAIHSIGFRLAQSASMVGE